MSLLEVLRRYMVERYPARKFALLAFFLCGSGFLALGSPQGNVIDAFVLIGRGVLLAYLIVLALRLWDDLEDRDHDAFAHPDRVTVRPEAATPLRYLSLVIAGIAMALVATGVAPLTGLVICALVVAGLATWYRVRASFPPSRVIAAHVVLAKYPVVAYLAARATLTGRRDFARAIPVFAAMYLLLCIHEALDDRELFHSVVGHRVMVAECVLMLPILALVVLSISHLKLF